MNTAITIILFICSIRGIEAMGALVVAVMFLWCLSKLPRF